MLACCLKSHQATLAKHLLLLVTHMFLQCARRCSVVAAANPAGGHYNRGKTVGENLKMGAALLSRFDLVFVLLDSPDDSHDKKLSEHIMRLHAAAAAGTGDRGANQVRLCVQ
jgi:DNA replicative helicase MCM subunit Mcm2 (Cdc46/Mcm family)